MRSGRLAAATAGVAALLFLLPLCYLLSLSLMTPEEAAAVPPVLLPADPQFLNYPAAWTGIGLGGVIVTTLLLAVLVAGVQVLTAAAAAFALARLRFPGRRPIVRALVVLAAIPSLVLLVPRYILVDAWGWADGFAGLAAPALVSALAILFLYQVFRGLPREPEESARLDGAGEWVVFSRVVVPQARPALAVVAGVAALAQWRGLLWPLVVTRGGGPEVAELALARAMVGGADALTAPHLMAIGLSITLPALALGLWMTLVRTRDSAPAPGSAPQRELPPQVTPLAPGPFEHQIL